MKRITAILVVAIVALSGSARAQCNREVTKPQKSRRVARLDWTSAGRTWQVALFWRTLSVSDNGEEEASVGLFVRDNIEHPKLGEFKSYDLTPSRCNSGIDPSLSTVKLMGRDFLLVTVPDGGSSGTVILAMMYSIDEKGHLTEVFQGCYRGHYLATPECRFMLRSYIRPENADGSRFSWVYEYPSLEWVRKKSDCAKAKIYRVEFSYEWKNGCFPMTAADDSGHRLTLSNWDEKECVMGRGLPPKAAPRDGGAGK